MRTKKKLEIAINALMEIAYPLVAMENALVEGERLNGTALVLANDAEYLKSIAKKALMILSEKQDY
jgi:hypothetical protein